MIKQEGAQAVYSFRVILITTTNLKHGMSKLIKFLGQNFPYFAVIGNHDLDKWPEYQQLLKQRMARIGLSWQGELGEQATITYNGLLMVMIGIGTKGDADVHNQYLAQQLQQNNAIWRIAAWHKTNKPCKQVARLTKQAGKFMKQHVYREQSLQQATNTLYSRSYLLNNMQQQTIENKENTF